MEEHARTYSKRIHHLNHFMSMPFTQHKHSHTQYNCHSRPHTLTQLQAVGALDLRRLILAYLQSRMDVDLTQILRCNSDTVITSDIVRNIHPRGNGVAH